MSKDWYQDILDYTDSVVGDRMQDGKPFPHALKGNTRYLKIDLIDEEVNEELIPALKLGNIVKSADGAVDSIVVIIGAMISCGIDIRPIWDEIHRTNLMKKGGPIREDGKRLKPEGWKPPEIEKEIRRQRNASI